MYDVAIIGAGVVGAALAEALSRYEIRACLLEREMDVGDGTTKANSGIVHAGYDARPGTWMARLNVRGSQLMEGICQRLGVAYNRCGSLVLAFTDEDTRTLEDLLERGRQNGVEGLRILSGDEVREMEPAISEEVVGALHAPSAAVVDPFMLCVGLAESAALNGVDIFLGSEVTTIRLEGSHFAIQAGDHETKARWVVNAAGVHADTVARLAGDDSFKIRPVRGEYYLMDKEMGAIVHSVVFQCPSAAGKGVLVSPTACGNLIVGPNAEDVPDGDDVSTTAQGQDYVRRTAARSVPGIDYHYSIRNFAGVRAYSDTGDFVIRASETVPHLVHLAGICSPGLSSSPAIAEACVDLLREDGLELIPKKEWAEREIPLTMSALDAEGKQEAIRKNPLYGHVICRCETVTEGEIVDALRRVPQPATIDGIKRRLGAGLGRCQGGFCMPRVLEIISRETGKAPKEVLLDGPGSNIVEGRLGE